MSQEKYQPTPAEIAAAESMMTDEHRAMSKAREKEFGNETTNEKEPKKTLYLVYRDNKLFGG